METETDKIFKEQLRKLPSEVVDFISSTNWDADLDEIGSLYNLPEKEQRGFSREATLVLMGLVHPDAFKEVLEQEVGITNRAVLEALVANVENKIFASIHPALIEFFENEAQNNAEQPQTVLEAVPPVLSVPKVPPVPRMPDVAPDNLPTGEIAEPLLPPIPLKPSPLDVGRPSNETPLNWDITPTHTFEEKMKKVFTTGQQSMGDLTLDPSSPSVVPLVPTVPNVPPPPRTYRADPYREAVE